MAAVLTPVQTKQIRTDIHNRNKTKTTPVRPFYKRPYPINSSSIYPQILGDKVKYLVATATWCPEASTHSTNLTSSLTISWYNSNNPIHITGPTVICQISNSPLQLDRRTHRSVTHNIQLASYRYVSFKPPPHTQTHQPSDHHTAPIREEKFFLYKL